MSMTTDSRSNNGDGFSATTAPNFFAQAEQSADALVEFESPTPNAFRKAMNSNAGFSLTEKENENADGEGDPERGTRRIQSVDFFDFTTSQDALWADASNHNNGKNENNDSNNGGSMMKFPSIPSVAGAAFDDLDDDYNFGADTVKDSNNNSNHRSSISKLLTSSPLRTFTKPRLGSTKNPTAGVGSGDGEEDDGFGFPTSPQSPGTKSSAVATSKMPSVLLSPMGKKTKLRKKQFDANTHIGEITVNRDKLPMERGDTSGCPENGDGVGVFHKKEIKMVDGEAVLVESPPMSPDGGSVFGSPMSAQKKKNLEKKFRKWWAGQSAETKKRQEQGQQDNPAVDDDTEPADVRAEKALELVVDRAVSVPYVAAGDVLFDEEGTISPTVSGTSSSSTTIREKSVSQPQRIDSISPHRSSKKNSGSKSKSSSGSNKRSPLGGDEHSLSNSKSRSSGTSGSGRRGRRSRRISYNSEKRDRSSSAGPRLERTDGGSGRRGRRTTGNGTNSPPKGKKETVDLHTVLSSRPASPRRPHRASAGRDRRSTRSHRSMPVDHDDAASTLTDAKSSAAQSAVSFSETISKSSTLTTLSPSSSTKKPVSILKAAIPKHSLTSNTDSSDEDVYHDEPAAENNTQEFSEQENDNEEDVDGINRRPPKRTVSDRYRQVGITAEQLRGLRALGLDITEAQIADGRKDIV